MNRKKRDCGAPNLIVNLYSRSNYQARRHWVAWGAKCHLCAAGYQLFATPLGFSALFILLLYIFIFYFILYYFIFYISYYCYFFHLKLAKDSVHATLCQHFRRVPSRSLQLIRKFNIFLYTHFLFDCDNVKYEVSSQILYLVIAQGQICPPPRNTCLPIRLLAILLLHIRFATFECKDLKLNRYVRCNSLNIPPHGKTAVRGKLS